MAPRAFWTGNLRLSLVNIPVRLYPATSTERKIELHQIHEPSGKRIRYQKVAPGVGAVAAQTGAREGGGQGDRHRRNHALRTSAAILRLPV